MFKVISSTFCCCALLFSCILAAGIDVEMVQIAELMCQLDEPACDAPIFNIPPPVRTIPPILEMVPFDQSKAKDMPSDVNDFINALDFVDLSTEGMEMAPNLGIYNELNVPFTHVIPHSSSLRVKGPLKDFDPKKAYFEFRYLPEVPKLKPGMSRRAPKLAKLRFDMRCKLQEWLETLELFGCEKKAHQYYGYFIAREMAAMLRKTAIGITEDEICSQKLSEPFRNMLKALLVDLPYYFDPENKFLNETQNWRSYTEYSTKKMIDYLYQISRIGYPSDFTTIVDKAEAVNIMAKSIFNHSTSCRN